MQARSARPALRVVISQSFISVSPNPEVFPELHMNLLVMHFQERSLYKNEYARLARVRHAFTRSIYRYQNNYPSINAAFSYRVAIMWPLRFEWRGSSGRVVRAWLLAGKILIPS